MRLSDWAKKQGIDKRTAYRMYHTGTLPANVRVTKVEGPQRTQYLVEEVQDTDRSIRRVDVKLDDMLRRIETQLDGIQRKIDRGARANNPDAFELQSKVDELVKQRDALDVQRKGLAKTVSQLQADKRIDTECIESLREAAESSRDVLAHFLELFDEDEWGQEPRARAKRALTAAKAALKLLKERS